jgi:hypothetical protein
MTTTAKTCWDDDLPEMHLDALAPFYDELKGHEVDAARDFGEDRKHVRRSEKRVMLDARRLTNALTHIGRLPEPNQSYHLVSKGAYSLWHVIKATLQFASPATIAHLRVATLGFSKDNLEQLLRLLDEKQIGRVGFLYSVYFKSNEREICERLAYELTSRGHQVVAMLQHAKVLTIELSDGRALAVESSANLRSCASLEQITITHDRALHDFHAQWMDEVLAGGDPKNGKR